LPQLGIHLGVGIVALIINAFIGAVVLLLILRLVGGWPQTPLELRKHCGRRARAPANGNRSQRKLRGHFWSLARRGIAKVI
jgi:hypothetical protein